MLLNFINKHSTSGCELHEKNSSTSVVDIVTLEFILNKRTAKLKAIGCRDGVMVVVVVMMSPVTGSESNALFRINKFKMCIKFKI